MSAKLKRPKLSLTSTHVSPAALEEFQDAFEEPSTRDQRAKLRRWRRLKHQLA